MTDDQGLARNTTPAPPVPPVVMSGQIVTNLMEFMRRAKSDGIEALAWAEAYAFLQHLESKIAPLGSGVPFTGLPK
jgi:hypothetical protein